MIVSGELDMDEAIANQPAARLDQASEMAAAVLWLCSPGGVRHTQCAGSGSEQRSVQPQSVENASLTRARYELAPQR